MAGTAATYCPSRFGAEKNSFAGAYYIQCAFYQLQNVYSGKAIVIDWRTAIEPVIRVKYSSSSGKAFIHHPSNPVSPPLLPVTWNFNKFNVWKNKFDKVGKLISCVDALD